MCRVFCHAVSGYLSAPRALMNDLPALVRFVGQSHRFHQRTAIAGPVADVVVNVQGIKTSRAVISVAAICQFFNVQTTVCAGKPLVFIFSRHPELLDFDFEIQGAGFRLFLGRSAHERGNLSGLIREGHIHRFVFAATSGSGLRGSYD